MRRPLATAGARAADPARASLRTLLDSDELLRRCAFRFFRSALLNALSSTAAAVSTKEDAHCGRPVSYTCRTPLRVTPHRSADPSKHLRHSLPPSTLTSPHFSENPWGRPSRRRTTAWPSMKSFPPERGRDGHQCAPSRPRRRIVPPLVPPPGHSTPY